MSSTVGSIYNKTCVVILITISYLTMFYATWYYLKLIDSIFVDIGLIIGAIACFIGQTSLLVSHDGNNIWDLIDLNDDQLVVLNKHILGKLILAPFFGIGMSAALFEEWGIWALAIVLPIAIFGVAIGVVQVIALAISCSIIFVATYVFVMLARLIYGAYYSKHIKHIVCHDCGNLSNNHSFICPRCGAIHPTLNPGQYGIIHKRCKSCKTLLYLSPWKKYAYYDLKTEECSDCFNINGSQPILISMAGGTNCGKTAYIKKVSEILSNNFNTRIYNDTGVMPGRPTPMGYQNPFVVEIMANRVKNPKRLFFYDISGKEFGHSGIRTYFQKQYRYDDGWVFIIDGQKIDGGNYNGIKETEDAFETFIICLNTVTGCKINEKLSTPLAIVISKVLSMRDTVSNDDAETYLFNNGLANMVNIIKSRFSKYKFFVCDNNSGTGTMVPVTWITSFSCRPLANQVEKL